MVFDSLLRELSFPGVRRGAMRAGGNPGFGAGGDPGFTAGEDPGLRAGEGEKNKTRQMLCLTRLLRLPLHF